MTGNRAEAEELMQDAFLSVWERWDRVSGMDDPIGYLYRTAMNLFRKRYRRAMLAVRLDRRARALERRLRRRRRPTGRAARPRVAPAAATRGARC